MRNAKETEKEAFAGERLGLTATQREREREREKKSRRGGRGSVEVCCRNLTVRGANTI